jgi:hypothetical protein
VHVAKNGEEALRMVGTRTRTPACSPSSLISRTTIRCEPAFRSCVAIARASTGRIGAGRPTAHARRSRGKKFGYVDRYSTTGFLLAAKLADGESAWSPCSQAATAPGAAGVVLRRVCAARQSAFVSIAKTERYRTNHFPRRLDRTNGGASPKRNRLRCRQAGRAASRHGRCHRLRPDHEPRVRRRVRLIQAGASVRRSRAAAGCRKRARAFPTICALKRREPPAGVAGDVPETPARRRAFDGHGPMPSSRIRDSPFHDRGALICADCAPPLARPQGRHERVVLRSPGIHAAPVDGTPVRAVDALRTMQLVCSPGSFSTPCSSMPRLSALFAHSTPTRQLRYLVLLGAIRPHAPSMPPPRAPHAHSTPCSARPSVGCPFRSRTPNCGALCSPAYTASSLNAIPRDPSRRGAPAAPQLDRQPVRS